MKPLAIDLFCGLGGWCEGLQAVGYRVVGFDNVRHRYQKYNIPDVGSQKIMSGKNKNGTTLMNRAVEKYVRSSLATEEWMEYQGQLVLQDVLTLHGSQFKDAALIVASPPCQFFSYCAMPWKRAKKLAADTRADPLVMEKELSLFNACFRLQREACEAAGRHIPMVVENVRGAEKWVGPAKWKYLSFYLWGDVPVVMPHEGFKGFKGFKRNWRDCEASRSWSSKSAKRKAWSAQIAKIPRPLAEWIGRVYYPEERAA